MHKTQIQYHKWHVHNFKENNNKVLQSCKVKTGEVYFANTDSCKMKQSKLIYRVMHKTQEQYHKWHIHDYKENNNKVF